MSEVRRQVAMPPRPSWAWQDAGLCRGKDIVLFFGPDGERQPEREVRERKAKAPMPFHGQKSTAPGAA